MCAHSGRDVVTLGEVCLDSRSRISSSRHSDKILAVSFSVFWCLFFLFLKGTERQAPPTRHRRSNNLKLPTITWLNKNKAAVTS